MNTDEARVNAVLAGSRLVQWAEQAMDLPPLAWQSSATRRLVEPLALEFQSLPAAERVRLIGWMAVVAVVTHIVLVLTFGGPAGWPAWASRLTLLALAFAAARGSRAVAAAWANRRPWLRRLSGEPEPWR